MKDNLADGLSELHMELTDYIRNKLKEGDVSPALLKEARELLKQNNISVDITDLNNTDHKELLEQIEKEVKEGSLNVIPINPQR